MWNFKEFFMKSPHFGEFYCSSFDNPFDGACHYSAKWNNDSEQGSRRTAKFTKVQKSYQTIIRGAGDQWVSALPKPYQKASSAVYLRDDAGHGEVSEFLARAVDPAQVQAVRGRSG